MISPTVLQIGAFPFPSHQGSQIYVGGMCQALARCGARVILVCWAGRGPGPIPEGVEIVRTPAAPGDHILRSGPHPARMLQDLQLIPTLRRILDRGGIDIIHAHNVEAPVAAALARGRAGPPLVYNLHTTLRHELPTYLPRGRRLARRFGACLDRWVPRLCDAGVAISPAAATELARRGLDPVATIPPGIDLADLAGADADRARRRHGLGPGPWVIYAGNTDGYQDLPDLLDAMARLPAARLLVVTGSEAGALRRAAADRGLGPDRFRLVVSRRFADTRDALAAGAVAVLPRRRCTGFPIKLLNQLGLGVPTVAAAGSAAAIDGVVPVPSGDPVAMAAAIAALLADPDRRAALGAAARRAVRTDWTWGVRARALLSFYSTIPR